MIVREGTLDDVDWLCGQLEAFSEYLGTKHAVYDEAHARASLPILIEEHLCLVAVDDGGERVGALGAYAIPHPLSPKLRTLAEQFWWVTPNSRGGRAALMLLDRYVEIGKACADWVTIAKEKHSPLNERCLEKRGFVHQECAYVLEV